MPKQKSQNEEYWRKILTDEEYRVCRQKGTEKPFTGEFYAKFENGIYTCTCCKSPLFDSKAKFDSGSGWPSFFEPVDDWSTDTAKDQNRGMLRTEVVCKECGAHLGHVFDDGPKPTGKRYCINSVALKFRHEKQ